MTGESGIPSEISDIQGVLPGDWVQVIGGIPVFDMSVEEKQIGTLAMEVGMQIGPGGHCGFAAIIKKPDSARGILDLVMADAESGARTVHMPVQGIVEQIDTITDARIGRAYIWRLGWATG